MPKRPLAETNALSVSSARRNPAASAGRDTTASIGPFPTQDRVPAELALAYAAQADGVPRTLGRLPNVWTIRGCAALFWQQACRTRWS